MARRTYTTKQVLWAIAQVRSGATRRSVAAALGCEEGAVQKWCKKAGLPKWARGRKDNPPVATNPPGTESEIRPSRRVYLARLLRDAIPDAIRHASQEFMKKLE